MAFSLAFDTSGAAFDDDPRGELVRIMRAAADALEAHGGAEGIVRDRDGYIVGRWRRVGCGE